MLTSAPTTHALAMELVTVKESASVMLAGGEQTALNVRQTISQLAHVIHTAASVPRALVQENAAQRDSVFAFRVSRVLVVSKALRLRIHLSSLGPRSQQHPPLQLQRQHPLPRYQPRKIPYPHPLASQSYSHLAHRVNVVG